MISRGVEIVCWTVAAGAVVWGVGAGTDAPFRVLAGAQAIAPPETAMPTVSAESLGVAARDVIERDPFRLARRPARVAFHQGGPEAPPVDSVPVPELLGIVGGPPWQALLQGLPGQTGPLLVKVGDEFGPVSVRAISADTVLVAVNQSAVKLTVRQPWR